MKEKVIGILKNKKVIKIAVIAVIAIIVIILLANLFSAKPKKYEDKIKDFVKAMSSESKMEDIISEGKIIDTRAAAAWLEADQSAKDFKDEYKDIKKNSDEVEEMEDGLKAYAENREDYNIEYKVSKIKEPEKSSSNSKIYTVSATMTVKYSSTEIDQKVKFVFYKGKIIDIKVTDTKASIFEDASELDSDDDDEDEDED